MGLTDKISGRVKQAAGDLAGSDDLKRQGAQEERKADAKAELAAEEARLQRTEAEADARREDAEQRAAAAARKEFERADRDISRDEAEVQARADRAQAKADEVRGLEHATSTGRLVEDMTKDELYEEAQARDIEGRSEMTKDELADAIRRSR